MSAPGTHATPRGAFKARFTETANYEMLQRIYGDALEEARARAA